MSGTKLILVYSLRIVRRQWRRFVLSFLSLGITALVMVLTLLLSNSSGLLLQSQAKELIGGDVVIESNLPFASEPVLAEANLNDGIKSNQLSFSGTLVNGELSSSFSVKVVDEAFPLYGEITLNEGQYSIPTENEIYVDASGAERLGLEIGDSISFGEFSFILKGVILSEPTSLLAGFRFFPQAILSQSGFAKAQVDPALLRAEYSSFVAVNKITEENIQSLNKIEEDSRGALQINIAGVNRTGPERGVQLVADFLVIAVLITAVLAAVNVYASTLYLVTVERKTLAILLALGMSKKRLVAVLALALGYVVVLSSFVGAMLGSLVFYVIQSQVASSFGILLPTPSLMLYILVCIALVFTIAVASFIPAILRTLSLQPKQLLGGSDFSEGHKFSIRTILFLTGSTLLPLSVLASFLLGGVADGLLSMVLIALVYVAVAVVFYFGLQFFYRTRERFSFFVRGIISQKKADGLFGIVSFTSLFVALTALSTLALLQISLERYLTDDLSRSIPSTYVLDVQPSQLEGLADTFPDLKLFSNISARIISIDTVSIQEELQKTDSSISRELGREFHLTARNNLLDNEKITDGVWTEGRSGDISVDVEFAKRANIKIGSQMVFSIQGFEVKGRVTSFRDTDSRSGLPFFYFVLSPEDVGSFPAVYFGYAYLDDVTQKELGTYIGQVAPNVSVIDTGDLAPLLLKIVSTLLLMILVVTLPPLLIATLLVATLVVSSYSARRREGGRLRALGATKSYVLRQYVSETLSLTLMASLCAYICSVVLTGIIGIYFLELDYTAIFDLELVIGFVIISSLVALIALYLFKSDTMPLRELLSYGDTN